MLLKLFVWNSIKNNSTKIQKYLNGKKILGG